MSNFYWLITGLLQPFTVLVVLLGLLIFWPQPTGTLRRRWLKLCYVVFYIYCTPLAAYTSTWLLERPFPRVAERPADLDAIVVLGGGLVRADADAQRYGSDESSFGRCCRAAELYRNGPPCPILVSGGAPYRDQRLPAVGDIMSETLVELGVAKSDVVVEDESLNTEQNAALSARIIRERGWKRIALVTGATHLRRSQRLFQRNDIETIPIGCQYRTDEFQWNVFAFLPRERAIQRQHEAFHEFLGMLFLMLRGRW